MKDDRKTKKQLIDELTELHSQNAVLKKSESAEKYRSLVENIKDVIYELDSQGVVLYISPAVRDMLGFDSTEIIGKNFIELAHKDDLSSRAEWFSELRKGVESPSEYRVSDKSGQVRWAQTRVRSIMEGDQFKGARGILIDITEQRKIVEALRESEEKYRLTFENVVDVIYVIDANLNVLSVSPSVQRILGYKPQDFIGRPVSDLARIFTPESFKQAIADIGLLFKGETIPATLYRFIAKDGTIKYGEVSGSPVMRDDKIVGIISVARDITERKHAEDALRESEDRYRRISSMTSDVTYSCSTKEDGLFSIDWMIGAAERISGYSIEEIKAQRCWRFMVIEEDLALFEEKVMNLAPGLHGVCELRIRHKNGDIVWLVSHVECIMDTETPERFHLYGGLIDITDRKRAEEALKESENKYRVIAENMTDVITIMDMNLRFTYVSPSIMRMRRYTVEETMEQSLEQVMTPESLQISAKVFEEEMQRETSGTADPNRVRTLELEEYRKDMSTVWVEVTLSFLRNADGRPIGILSLSRDITQRRRAEETLRESEEKYRELVRYAPAGIYEVDYETNRFISVNDIICEYTGYSRDELFTMNLFNLLTKESQPLMLTRLEKLMAGEKLEPTVEYCIRTKNGNELWGLFNARYIYEAGKLKGSTGVIYDITDRKRADEKLRQTLERLRKAVGTTIQVMVSAVEARDPYTAGHQVRSADLARAIATEMGLPQERIEGLRMAGSIHDIGKISIPAELLSKPTKLTNIEFSLIKEHSRMGYEMLKDVESPWPLAEIVYQHHERMDGSGYPRSLKGDEILMEARILAVSDVVESMASHRPYRPALGIEPALEEIEKNKGTLYDDAVAGACLRLFREKGFQLEKA